ncbi:tetratricopeptide repeat protein [Thermovibrio sp.]
MKRKIIALLSFFLLHSPVPSLSKEVSFEQSVESKIKCPSSFLQNPPVYFYCIYRDYHNHKFDDGIEKAKRALSEIEPILKKNPKAVIPNAVQKIGRLRDPHAYAVASDLHMLLGMLYYKKAMNLKDTKEKEEYLPFIERLEKKGFNFFQINELMNLYTMKRLFPDQMTKEEKRKYGELLKKMGVSEKELDEITEKAQKVAQQQDEERLKYLRLSFKEFQEAVKVDPDNALAYYQLGNLYSGALSESAPEASQAAEEAYYKAALILKKKGDIEGYKEVVKRLELVNPNSKYLKLLEKGKKNA